MKRRLIKNLGFLQVNKLLIAGESFNRLNQTHHAAIRELDNMILLQRVSDTPLTTKPRREIVYDKDGQAREVSGEKSRLKQGWEKQFETKLHNPPCYILPPSNMYSISRVKRSTMMPEPHHVSEI